MSYYYNTFGTVKPIFPSDLHFEVRDSDISFKLDEWTIVNENIHNAPKLNQNLKHDIVKYVCAFNELENKPHCLKLCIKDKTLLDIITKQPFTETDTALVLIDGFNLMLVNYKEMKTVLKCYYKYVLDQKEEMNEDQEKGEILLSKKWMNVLSQERVRRDKTKEQLRLYKAIIENELSGWDDKLELKEREEVLGNKAGEELKLEQEETSLRMNL